MNKTVLNNKNLDIYFCFVPFNLTLHQYLMLLTHITDPPKSSMYEKKLIVQYKKHLLLKIFYKYFKHNNYFTRFTNKRKSKLFNICQALLACFGRERGFAN